MRAKLPELDRWETFHLPSLYCENPGIIRISSSVDKQTNKYLIFGEENSILLHEDIQKLADSKYVVNHNTS